MAGPFATIRDVEARWRPLTSAQEELAGVLLDDASAVLRAEYPGIDTQIAAGNPSQAVVTAVVAGMVKRAMISGDNEGVKADSETIGPYSVSRTYANALGSLFLTAADRLLLVGRQAAARSVRFAD